MDTIYNEKRDLNLKLLWTRNELRKLPNCKHKLLIQKKDGSESRHESAELRAMNSLKETGLGT